MRRTILCGNLLLLVVLCDDVFGQARGGAGGIGAASGGPGGPGIGVSGGGTAALGNSFSAWAGLNPSGGFGVAADIQHECRGPTHAATCRAERVSHPRR